MVHFWQQVVLQSRQTVSRIILWSVHFGPDNSVLESPRNITLLSLLLSSSSSSEKRSESSTLPVHFGHEFVLSLFREPIRQTTQREWPQVS